MLYHFKNQKYPISTLQKAFDKVRVLNRQELLKETDDKDTEENAVDEPLIVPLLTKYYPNCDPNHWIHTQKLGHLTKIIHHQRAK